ncbi:DDE-type integrase/transposase/recombinase [Promicromonospora soli]
MHSNSVPADVRWAIVKWPDDAPRGAVAAFCAEHGISRQVFAKIRKRARDEGQIAAAAPKSRAPRSSPARTDRAVIAQALAVRSSLSGSGLDHGPLSVADRMRRAGDTPPSRATLARAFLAEGVVVPDPSKKPRSAWRRFVYPAPNCLWQIDAMDWTLADGSAAAIFQVTDDHSRMNLASLAARGETSKAAIDVVCTAMDRWGIPVMLLSDNGAALNPTRRGHTGQLVEFLKAKGVTPITGKPYKPTTQGKNERGHQTLIKFLNAQPPAETLDQLQAYLDEYDEYYNRHRGHQAHRTDQGLLTPWEVWQATLPADPPAPPTDQAFPLPVPPPVTPGPTALAGIPDTVTTRVGTAGRAGAHGTEYHVGTEHTGTTVTITYTTTTVTIHGGHDHDVLQHYTRPEPGTKYAGPRTHPAPKDEK